MTGLAHFKGMTPEALAAQTNVGLVKRAQKEIANGQGPTLREEDGGAVVATFPDGVTTRLLPGKPLKDSPCSCGASAVCRHRIAAVLVLAATGSTTRKEPWEIGEEDLRVWLGKRVEAVDAAEAEGVFVELGLSPPLARFPSCTVRFLAGGDLSHARCDCAAPSCVHIPLAVRAFSRLSEEDKQKGTAKVRLGPPPRPMVEVLPLDAAERLLVRHLEFGIADARGLAQAREEVRAGLRGLPWLDALFESIEEQRAAWENRSALHDAGQVRRLFAEGFARIRAARRGGDLGRLLGKGEPLECPLGRTRLLSLGARLSAIGTARSLEVLFWDGATVVSWTVPIPDGVDPGTHIAVASTPLSVLAAGQVVSSHLVRLARRTIQVERGRDTAVMPQRGQWSDVPAPFGFSGPGALLRDDEFLPPMMLRPRTRTTALRVVATNGGVSDLAFSPGRQTLSGTIADEGGALRIERAYEWFAPGAITSLAASLPEARYVSGWLRESDTGGARVLEPVAVVTDRVVIPDLAPKAPIPALPIEASRPRDPLSIVLSRLEAALSALAEEGLLRGRIEPLGPALEEIGLRAMAAAYGRMAAAKAGSDIRAAAEAWADAAILGVLARG